MAIRLLSDEVASQIAAGEVIERPASVVKELIENSLDAKATSIEVRVEGGGVRLIEVIDDGCGMAEAELPLAVMRHATSKLSSAQDLFNIATLGFRGEALASIASVARVTLISRAQDAERAAIYVVEGGKSAPLQAHPHPKGTLVRVEDLFFNVPARRKFLKKESTEKRVIEFLCSQYAIAFPQVRFKLQQDRHPSFQTTGKGDWLELLSLIFGRDTARQLLNVEFMEEGISLHGFISPFNVTSSHRNDILFYVNQRPIKDTALASAFIKAYHGMLMVGRYPLGVLFIGLPVHEVDVNVHPTKAEVRFRDKERIFAAIVRAVRRTLISSSPIPQVYPSLSSASASSADLQTQQYATDWKRAIDPAWQFAHEEPEGGTKSAFVTSQEELGNGVLKGFVQIPLLRQIGQVANAYLIAEGPDGIYLIDQHAAHERILFEKMIHQLKAEPSSQTLLEPVVVQVASYDNTLIEKEVDLLRKIGFQLEPFGGNTWIVRAIPAILDRVSPQAALKAVLDELDEDETPLQHDHEAKLIARICKRSAIKAGTSLSPLEQEALLRDLQACEAPRSCPHGRPTMIHLSVDTLERQFNRKGPKS